jgi:hypothetical protein
LEDILLASYFGETHARQSRRLLGMKYMLLLFSAMWGLVQHGLQQAGEIPAPQDFDYLEYAQYLFKNDVRQLMEQLNRSPDH